MPDVHARLSPSAMHRIIVCPSSLREQEKYERTYGRKDDSAYAKEGTAAHELAERCLNENRKSAHYYVDIDAENGVTFTEDMCDSVDEYLESLRGYVHEGDTLLVEQKVDFSKTIGVPDSFGTSDAVVLKADGTEIQVHDLKFGKGVKVYAEENQQGMTYALGALAEHDLAGTVKYVRIVIHQPRLNHYDEWLVRAEYLLNDYRPLLEKQGKLAVRIADNDDDVESRQHMHPDDKACRFCTIKHSCPALLHDVVEASTNVEFTNLEEVEANQALAAEISRVGQLSLDELAEVMKFTDLIIDWAKAVQERVASELHDGKTVVGYKLVEGKKGNRKWVDEEEAEKVLKSMRLKAAEMYKQTLITPTTAEKLFKSNPRKWNRLNDCITQSEGKLTVVPTSDKRPEVRLGVADVTEFNNLDDDCGGLA